MQIDYIVSVSFKSCVNTGMLNCFVRMASFGQLLHASLLRFQPSTRADILINQVILVCTLETHGEQDYGRRHPSRRKSSSSAAPRLTCSPSNWNDFTKSLLSQQQRQNRTRCLIFDRLEMSYPNSPVFFAILYTSDGTVIIARSRRPPALRSAIQALRFRRQDTIFFGAPEG